MKGTITMNHDNNLSNIGSRIKYIRKSLNLSQEQFAKPLGLTKAAISTYEKAQRTPSSTVTLLICYYYNINIDYLKNGRGCIHTDISDTYINTIASEYHLDPISKNIVGKYLTLTVKERANFNNCLTNLITLLHPDENNGTDKME